MCCRSTARDSGDSGRSLAEMMPELNLVELEVSQLGNGVKAFQRQEELVQRHRDKKDGFEGTLVLCG